MMQSLRDWLIRWLGGVTERDHEIECLECIAMGRFEAQAQNVIRVLALRGELRAISADLDVDADEADRLRRTTH